MIELACARESEKVYEVGALPAIMTLIVNHGEHIYKDTLNSCMTIISRLMSRVEPKDPQLDSCVASLSLLLQHTDPHVSMKKTQQITGDIIHISSFFISESTINVENFVFFMGALKAQNYCIHFTLEQQIFLPMKMLSL